MSAYNKEYYAKNSKRIRANNKRWRDRNRPKLRAEAKVYYQGHKAKAMENCRNRRQKLRGEVLTHYGEGKLICVQCGYSDSRALSLDHINNNGAEERKKLFGRKQPNPRFWEILIKLGYPEGYQTLCMNCQFIKEAVRKKNLRS